MKNFILFTCLLFLYTSSFCQEGIHFEPLTFEQAKAKAKAEKKLIFMDCYTSWCGPCKYMTEQVFTRKEAGTYFNPRGTISIPNSFPSNTIWKKGKERY